MTNPNPSVPDPNAYPDSSPQQPSYQYQGGVPPQGAMQPGIQQQGMRQNWATRPGNEAAAQGYAQAGYAGYGYAPMAPVKRRVSYKLAGILSGICSPSRPSSPGSSLSSSRVTTETAETACTGSQSR